MTRKGICLSVERIESSFDNPNTSIPGDLFGYSNFSDNRITSHGDTKWAIEKKITKKQITTQYAISARDRGKKRTKLRSRTHLIRNSLTDRFFSPLIWPVNADCSDKWVIFYLYSHFSSPETVFGPGSMSYRTRVREHMRSIALPLNDISFNNFLLNCSIKLISKLEGLNISGTQHPTKLRLSKALCCTLTVTFHS